MTERRRHFTIEPAPKPTPDDTRSPAPIVKWSEQWWATRTPQVRARRCSAHRSNQSGERCRRISVEGAAVCPQHGGRAPQVKRKARERIELAADRMAAGLLKIATSAESESVKLRAIESALDRAGLMVPKQLDVEVGQKKPWELIAMSITSVGGTREDYACDRGLPAPADDHDEDVLDAEVIEDGPHSKARGRTGSGHTSGRPWPAGLDTAAYPGMPSPGYLPHDVAVDRIAESTRKSSTGRSRSSRARLR